MKIIGESIDYLKKDVIHVATWVDEVTNKEHVLMLEGSGAFMCSDTGDFDQFEKLINSSLSYFKSLGINKLSIVKYTRSESVREFRCN